MSNLFTRIRVWWGTRTDGEKAFYFTNTPMQIFLICFPAFWIDNSGDTIEAWYQSNPTLFDSLVFPALFGWIFLIFFARWALGWILVMVYKDHDLRLPWNYDERLSYFQEKSEKSKD